jgi:hypothetical protein
MYEIPEKEIDYNKIQKKLRSAQPIKDYDKVEINYVGKPIGQANFKNQITEDKYYEKIKADPKDLIQCIYCKCWITRRNMSAHRKTKKHQVQVQINNKLRELLVD